jgi:hypothetical protein
LIGTGLVATITEPAALASLFVRAHQRHDQINDRAD